MALQFAHSPVVILKRSLETRLINLRQQGDQQAIRVATNLLNGDLVDDYLVGTDDIMGEFELPHIIRNKET